MLKSIAPNDHDLLIPDCKCTRLPQLQARPSVRRSSRFHQRSCTLLGPGHLLGRSSDANSRPVVLQQAQNAMEAWCSLLTTAFFVPVLPMHCVSGWPRPKTAGTKVAWHDVAVSRTQTFKQNIFAPVICFPLTSCYRSGWRNNNMMGVCPVRNAAIAASLWCSAICLLIAQSPVVQRCIIASEGIRMCLFTSALEMFTVTTRYQCIIASGSECVCSMFTSLCLQLPPDHGHDVVQCIIA